MDRRRLLGKFLRARREATSLEDVGLLRVGRRCTPGLRREEVAMLAGVSTDYYARLEQGRERSPSCQVLDGLAKALDIDGPGIEYMYSLAHPRSHSLPTRREEVSPRLTRMLVGWGRAPAFITGRLLDVLATNDMADALFAEMRHRENLLHMIFLDPRANVFYPDWERCAFAKVARLRAAAADDPADPLLLEFVGELSGRSKEFRRMWACHGVDSFASGSKLIHHRDVGDLTLFYESLAIKSAPGQELIMCDAEPGSPSEEALTRLAEVATPDA